MIEKLGQKDIRALKLGAVGAVAIIVFILGAAWLEHWVRVRKSLAMAKVRLESLNPTRARREGLLSVVPVFEMPQSEQKQKFLFRDKFNEQLKKAGIKSKPLQEISAGKSKRSSGYRLLRLQCRSSKCNFSNILDLLAELNRNPYLVAAEEFGIKRDSKNKQQFELDLTVSTFVK